MKNVIIGTAGHVDHGKTLLIKALTGIDTDRLKEEKKRGITIDLGFAWLELPDGERAGIVDVPGHEKFVKNMLAGAGGIDLAMLIVAADDGVMPQTREHLGILSLLGIRSGVVVITKTDLVEPDWVELVAEDIREEVKGTFLEGAPIQTVSAYTGQGIEDLRQLLQQRIGEVAAREDSGAFRVPVDRVFSVDGFGTVITGTMIAGVLAEGEEIAIYPGGPSAKVRNLQVHSRDVERAFAGQRVAVNLAGIRKEEVRRGDVLATAGSMAGSMMLDVKLSVLRDSARVIENGTRLHFYHGAREALCKLVLLEADRLNPGEEGYAQLRFTEEVAAKKGDRFVLRFYSPVETVGGGVILDPNPVKRRRNNLKSLDALRIREQGSLAENLVLAIAEGAPRLAPLSEARNHLQLPESVFRQEVEQLVKAGRITLLGGGKAAVDAGYMERLTGSVREILGDYHKANPLQAGMRRDELRGRLLPGRDTSLADSVLAALADAGVLALDNQKAALADFKITYNDGDQKLAEKVEALFREGGYAPPGPDALQQAFPKEQKAVKKVMEAMLASGALVSVAPQIWFLEEMVAEAEQKVISHIREKGEISLAEFRDLSGTSRKFALSLLEYFDRHGVTKKVGDTRKLAKGGKG